MKAARLTQDGFISINVLVPEIGGGHILIKTIGCGICEEDV